LTKLRDGKDPTFTAVLSRVIPRLTGADRDKAREALEKRLERANSQTPQHRGPEPNVDKRLAASVTK
jgi:hypothetical protein